MYFRWCNGNTLECDLCLISSQDFQFSTVQRREEGRTVCCLLYSEFDTHTHTHTHTHIIIFRTSTLTCTSHDSWTVAIYDDAYIIIYLSHIHTLLYTQQHHISKNISYIIYHINKKGDHGSTFHC